jgi:hypothetical protein
MTILNSTFDIIGHDPHANARAGLMTVLAVEGFAGPYASLPASGTPAAGDIPAGSIVVMNSNGNAILADGDVATGQAPAMLFVTVDGDQDYSGAFVGKVTCIHGGAEFQLDTANFVAAAYTPGEWLTCGGTANAGKFTKVTGTPGTQQIYGMVGPLGYDSAKDTLHVIIPQGIAPAV